MKESRLLPPGKNKVSIVVMPMYDCHCSSSMIQFWTRAWYYQLVSNLPVL